MSTTPRRVTPRRTRTVGMTVGQITAACTTPGDTNVASSRMEAR